MTLNQIGSKIFTKMILEIQRFDLKIEQMVQELNQELDNIGVDQSWAGINFWTYQLISNLYIDNGSLL